MNPITVTSPSGRSTAVFFDGAVYRWASNRAVPPADAIAEYGVDKLPGFDAAAHDATREKETREFLAAYRAKAKPPTPEQLAEMRAAFGPGAEVVNVITGRVTKL